eukprot:4952466-Pyramimonas_sp.AAC.1
MELHRTGEHFGHRRRPGPHPVCEVHHPARARARAPRILANDGARRGGADAVPAARHRGGAE